MKLIVNNYLKNSLSVQEEKEVYNCFEYIRSLLNNKSKNKVKFFQLWQQKNFIADLKKATSFKNPKEYFLEEDHKDKKNNNCMFFLPKLDKIIYLNYKKGSRRIPGWVEYQETTY